MYWIVTHLHVHVFFLYQILHVYEKVCTQLGAKSTIHVKYNIVLEKSSREIWRFLKSSVLLTRTENTSSLHQKSSISMQIVFVCFLYIKRKIQRNIPNIKALSVALEISIRLHFLYSCAIGLCQVWNIWYNRQHIALIHLFIVMFKIF